MTQKQHFIVQAEVNIPLSQAWELWTESQHIMKWHQASEDWHTPYAENNLTVGGKYTSRMEAKDGSDGFDFNWVYDSVKKHEKIVYSMEDGRQVTITFKELAADKIEIIETVDAESVYPVEQQRQGWQAIMNSFKYYAEKLYGKA